MVEPREVVPEPFNVCVLAVFKRFVNAPPALLGPSRDEILLVAEEAREVCVAPVATADADSLTTMVTRSSTCAARTSLPRSVRREADVKSEPEEATGGASGCFNASCRYLSSAVGCVDFLAFLPAEDAGAARMKAIARIEIGIEKRIYMPFG